MANSAINFRPLKEDHGVQCYSSKSPNSVKILFVHASLSKYFLVFCFFSNTWDFFFFIVFTDFYMQFLNFMYTLKG